MVNLLCRTQAVAGALAISAVVIAVTGTAPAFATTGTVSAVPVNYTPWLLQSTPNQQVRELVQCGSTMYAVGTISSIGQGGKTYSRGNGMSFSATTGAMTAWDPKANGQISSIALSPDCSTAYLGGAFTSIGGAAASYIAAVNTSTGALISTFKHSSGGTVNTVQYTHGNVIAGGLFSSINGATRSRIASLDPTSGNPTSYVGFGIAGTYQNSVTKIYNAQISHAGDRMLVEGVFTSIGGVARQQVAMIDLGATSATVDGWNAPEFSNACSSVESFYVRAAAWSPDDQTMYVADTGYLPAGTSTVGPRTGLCDAAAAFPATSGATVTHQWINYTGCDSYYAVAADSNNVYVAGHERWANNGYGCDAAGPGALDRPGIASIDPGTGLATAWDPTRARGYGADDMLVTPAGLWVASDNFSNGAAQECGGVGNHGGICFFPY